MVKNIFKYRVADKTNMILKISKNVLIPASKM